MPERLNGAVSKTVVRSNVNREFESHSLRIFFVTFQRIYLKRILLLLIVCSLMMFHRQTFLFGQSKQTLIEMAKSGMFSTLSSSEIRQKLQEAGISEAEALKFAQENNIDVTKFTSQNIPQQNPPQTVQAVTGGVTVQIAPSSIAIDTTKQQGLLPDTTAIPKGTHGLEYFGYEIFKTIPAAFEPSAIGPVDPGYLIGPDDVIRLSIWGQAEFQYELTVDREGKVFIPSVGQITLTGIPLRELEAKLQKQLSKFYSGLATDPQTVFLDVTIAKLRPIRIFVMGEVKQPGGYTISSYATVFNALYSVGGPTVNGSLRNVKVLRENKVIATVDLYDYLLRGDKSSDVRLQNNDVVFIPVRGKTVAIAGEIKKPAVFELKENENFSALLVFSGGLKTTAYTKKSQIERIKPFKERKDGEDDRVLVDVNISLLLEKNISDISLHDADIVTVFSILDEQKNYVTITGGVLYPGKFELIKVKTISQLIISAGGLQPEAYLKKADIFRLRPDKTREYLSVNLEKLLAGEIEDNILLQELDIVHIYTRNEMQFEKNLSIRGHVKNEVTIPYADSITLFDLVFHAGGFEDSIFRKETFLPRGDIFRLNEDKISTRIIPFSLERLLTDSTYLIPLEANDQIVIYGIDVAEIKYKFVMISGEVKKPGKYILRSNLDVQSLILEAGGFTEEADIREAEISRLVPSGFKDDSLVQILKPKITNDFSATTNANPFLLVHRDHVLIRRNPNFFFHRNVKVEGEVTYPGTYSLQKEGERLSEILERAGGPSTSGYFGGASLIRGNRRVIVDFEKAYYQRDEKHNVILLAEDSLYIPFRPNTVVVVGEVNNPGMLGFLDGDDVEDYIERVGGETDSVKSIFLQKPSGETEEIVWYRFSPDVPDGSTIVLTKEPIIDQEVKPIDVGETIKDVFAILSSAATLAFLIFQVTK